MTDTATEMVISPASRLGEVKEYYFSRKLREIAALREAGHDVINLGIGSPDLPPDPAVVQELTTMAHREDTHGYQSYTGLPVLREAFADWYARWFRVTLDPNGEILPLIGSKEGLMHLAMAFLEPGDEVLVPNPGYPAYRAVSNLAGATIREYRLDAANGWLPQLDELSAQDLGRVKVMWVNYPNMPTGTPGSRQLMEQLVHFAQSHGILLVNDNPYAFILNASPQSILSVPGAREVALELNSLSKAHNMAGWRVGMLAGREDYLKVVLRFKSNMDSGMFKPLQVAAARALQSPPSWYEQLNAVYRERQAMAMELLDSLGCDYASQQVGLFLWGRVPAGVASGYALSDQVLENAHVFVTPGGIFGSQGESYIRLSLCSSIEIYREAVHRIKNRITW